MVYFLYTLTAIFSRTESTLGKFNGRKNASPAIFNLSKTATALLLSFVICIFSGLVFHSKTLLFSVIYGISMAASMYCGLMALATGPMAVASVIASFSLILPVGYGLIWLGESLSTFGIIGLILLPVSIVMLNLKKGGKKIKPVCWVYSFLTLFANGICSIVQKEHQTRFPGEYKYEFMLFGMAAAFLLFVLLSALQRRNEDAVSKGGGIGLIKISLIFGLVGGACNCGANLLTLYLASAENASILFPVISAANAVLSCLIGRVIFKEKLSFIQIISIALGISSVVMLKI